MSQVVLIKCDSYENEKVSTAVMKGLNLLGGAERFANLGEKILLKPNLLSADTPDRCSTTHFSVFKAVGKAFKDTGAEVTYGDSPGIHSMQAASKKSLIAHAAEEEGIIPADFSCGKEVDFAQGKQIKRFLIANGVLEADGIISISKMKTHALEIMTGAVKNQFGCVPGPVKATFHVRFPDMIQFARMLVDINMFIKPRLYIMDAIIAMEGNGPRNGNPKQMNLILMSDDPVALDATACRLMNLDPEIVPTNTTGMEAGMGTHLESEIELLGENIEQFISKDFVASKIVIQNFLTGKTFKKLGNLMVAKPVIINKKCILCKDCVNVCPSQPKTLRINKNAKTPPHFEYKNCIKCYCCQEMCPAGAIKVKVPFLLKKYYNLKR